MEADKHLHGNITCTNTIRCGVKSLWITTLGKMYVKDKQLAVPDLFTFDVIIEHTQMIREDIERYDWGNEDLLPRPDNFDRNTKCPYWNNKLEYYLYNKAWVNTEPEYYIMTEWSELSCAIYMEAILEIWNR